MRSNGPETGALTQLTKGPSELFAQCTGNGKWIIYGDNINSELMKVPVSGGRSSVAPIVPDGNFRPGRY